MNLKNIKMIKKTKLINFIYNKREKIIELSITGIACAVIATLISTLILDCQQKNAKIQEQLNSLSRVYIGCSKQWADEHFGSPQFMFQSKEYLLCAYISDFFVLQFAFNTAKSAEAYLITALTDDPKIKVEDNTINADIILCDLSYYNFIDIPENTYGFVSNGNARAFYGESYYFASAGNYYHYYIASFDYGYFKNTIDYFLEDLDYSIRDIDDEVTKEKHTGLLCITDRKHNYPNTYGVSKFEISDLLFSYDWFNSLQLKNTINPKH